MEIIVPWIVLSFAVAWFWKSKGLAFGSGLMWSLLLSPVLGLAAGFSRGSQAGALAFAGAAGSAVAPQGWACPHCGEGAIPTLNKMTLVCRNMHPTPVP